MSTARPPLPPPASDTNCAMLPDSVYRAHDIKTTRDKWASTAPMSNNNKPKMMPDCLNINGKDKQPAPMAEDTSVKMPAASDPSPMGGRSDKPTGSFRSHFLCACASCALASKLWFDNFLLRRLPAADLGTLEKSSHNHRQSSRFSRDRYSRKDPREDVRVGVDARHSTPSWRGEEWPDGEGGHVELGVEAPSWPEEPRIWE
mmetsp:Transcript_2322/g.5789  ORF Transcript_2322/g.5789 Transcript_2322/m.5789 type:complete len:202 (-) Transcript_2322:148-753(-)